jgi:hypothetical protein
VSGETIPIRVSADFSTAKPAPISYTLTLLRNITFNGGCTTKKLYLFEHNEVIDVASTNFTSTGVENDAKEFKCNLKHNAVSSYKTSDNMIDISYKV